MENDPQNNPPARTGFKQKLVEAWPGIRQKLHHLAAKFLSEKKIHSIGKFFQDKDERVLEDLLDLERENPGDTRVKIKIAETLFKRHQIAEAIQKLESAAQDFCRDEFHLKAIDVYKKILRIRPDYIMANLRLSELYQKLGMVTEAANQLRIIINHHAQEGELPEARELAEKVVRMDPSLENRIKLAEIYQSCRLTEQAVEQYENIAGQYRNQKNYDRLLHFYELIMPHKPENTAILKDICILHLRQKNPQRALHFMEQYKVADSPHFKELQDKANLMMDALKRQKNRKMG